MVRLVDQLQELFAVILVDNRGDKTVKQIVIYFINIPKYLG